jgi:hypothetical protein
LPLEDGVAISAEVLAANVDPSRLPELDVWSFNVDFKRLVSVD